MKIEIKNTDFKQLFEYLDNCPDTMPIDNIIETLRKQYDKAFNKYQDEKQEFEPGEKVKFRFYSKVWGSMQDNFKKTENNFWIDGSIKKVSRLANGKYKYIIEYIDEEGDEYGPRTSDGKYIQTTNPMTNKNIRKI